MTTCYTAWFNCAVEYQPEFADALKHIERRRTRPFAVHVQVSEPCSCSSPGNSRAERRSDRPLSPGSHISLIYPSPHSPSLVLDFRLHAIRAGTRGTSSYACRPLHKLSSDPAVSGEAERLGLPWRSLSRRQPPAHRPLRASYLPRYPRRLTRGAAGRSL